MPAKVTDEQRAKVIEAVRQGNHPHVACTAAGLSTDYFYVLRHKARNGDETARAFLLAIDTAQAQSEVDDVAAAHRATQEIAEAKIVCPHCGEQYVAEPEHLAALAMRIFDAQKAKSAAAEVALKKLERRYPKRWSQRVVHTVTEQHEQLLSVCERLLAPADFARVLEAYVAEGDGSGEIAGAESRPATGDVH